MTYLVLFCLAFLGAPARAADISAQLEYNCYTEITFFCPKTTPKAGPWIKCLSKVGDAITTRCQNAMTAAKLALAPKPPPVVGNLPASSLPEGVPANAGFSGQPLQGQIQNLPFRFDKGELDPHIGTLELQQGGDLIGDIEIIVFLFEKGKNPDGLNLATDGTDFSSPVHIHIRGNKVKPHAYTSKYKLDLTLGQMSAGKLPGKISLTLPDSSHVDGVFEVPVQGSAVPSGSAVPTPTPGSAVAASKALPAPSVLSAAPAPGATGDMDARLTHLEGTVYVHMADQPEDQFVQAEKDMSLDSGDLVRTGTDGKAEIAIDADSIIDVGNNTDFQASDLSESKTEWRLGTGSIAAKIRSLLPNQQMEFATPTAVAAIRGTELAVAQDDPNQPTRIGVLDEGIVAVTSAGGGQPVILSPGQETSVVKGKSPTPAKPLSSLAASRVEMEQVRKRIGEIRIGWRQRNALIRGKNRSHFITKPSFLAAKLANVRDAQRRMIYSRMHQESQPISHPVVPSSSQKSGASQVSAGQTAGRTPDNKHPDVKHHGRFDWLYRGKPSSNVYGAQAGGGPHSDMQGHASGGERHVH